MNSKQILFIFILFILALVVITLPVWLDRALPIITKNFHSAMKTLEDMWVSLKFISGRLAEDFMRLLDKHMFGN